MEMPLPNNDMLFVDVKGVWPRRRRRRHGRHACLVRTSDFLEWETCIITSASASATFPAPLRSASIIDCVSSTGRSAFSIRCVNTCWCRYVARAVGDVYDVGLGAAKRLAEVRSAGSLRRQSSAV